MIKAILAPLLLVSNLSAALPAKARPKLLVVISVDQFSAELMQTYGPELIGGIGRLRKEGVSFSEAYHDHGFTETGPGHSVLLSGRFPANTGIVENRWFDRTAGKLVYCVEDPTAKALNAPGQASASNTRFLGDALGDWLQVQVPGSRVFAISGKDRAAILMAGRKPTAVYWFSGPAGFTSSDRYADQLPGWLLAHDADLKERLTTQSWLWSKRTDTPEGRQAQWTIGGQLVRNGALPRLIQGIGMPLDKTFEARFRRSPFLDEVTLEAAEALIQNEHLGRGPGTDLLALSFSATDYIGHAYGMFGTEMRDQIHRLDRLLGRLLDQLRQKQPGAWVVLCADHGAWDIPEALAEQGFPARRIDTDAFQAGLNAALRSSFKLPSGPFRISPEAQSLYLDEGVVAGANVDRGALLDAAVVWLKARPEVAEAYRADELASVNPAASGSPRDTSLKVLLRRSFVTSRSGDVLVTFKPFIMLGDSPKDWPAGHGSPYAYDRRVPLIFWGPWKGGERREPVRTVDLAPTLAQELGIKPGTVDGKPLNLGPRK